MTKNMLKSIYLKNVGKMEGAIAIFFVQATLTLENKSYNVRKTAPGQIACQLVSVIETKDKQMGNKI